MPARSFARSFASTLAGLCCTLVLAQPLPVVPPDAVGLSPQALQRMTAAMKAEVDKGMIPGAVIAIARKGKLAYFETLGSRDPATREPMPRDAIFSIASMTKPMVSVAIMMLHDEGKLLLSSPISQFFPALANRRVGVVKRGTNGAPDTLDTEPARRQPTVQDLLRHTAGFTYGARGDTPVHKLWPGSSSTAATEYSAPAFIEALAKAPLLYQPGTVWDYSLSVDLLGLIVEQVSGQTLGAFLSERIWKPLGMVDTSFVVPADKMGRYARAFAIDPTTQRPPWILHASSKTMQYECGGGCAVSTASDYLRFAQMLLNGGSFEGKRLLSRKTVEMMTADHLGPAVRARTTSTVLPEGYGFGLGFAVRAGAGVGPLAGSAGDFYWGGAFGTTFWVDPKEQMAVVYMAAAPGGTHRTLLRNLAMAAVGD